MSRAVRRRGNLPVEVTSFVGRRRELADLRQKLQSAHLVSLVGPGGVGKTRLALHAAAGLARAFPSGAWLVDLADVRDSALVANAFLTALDLRNQTTSEPHMRVVAYVRDQRLLIVVDNCEHVLDVAARLISQMIAAAPAVRIIATSREPLSVAGEHVMPIPPLELPSPDIHESLDLLRQNEAVQLFVERAAAASGRFELTAMNRGSVARLCRHLDGLPLAIELAAVRSRALSSDQILTRLADRFELLTGGSRAALPRHQTLQTTIDWSFDLLGADERTLFRRLSAFGGQFMLEDVESVCAFGDVPVARAVDLVSSLVGKSLVVKEEFGSLPCFRLHESVREYARLKLEESDETDVVNERSTAYYLARCLESVKGSQGFNSRAQIAAWVRSSLKTAGSRA